MQKEIKRREDMQNQRNAKLRTVKKSDAKKCKDMQREEIQRRAKPRQYDAKRSTLKKTLSKGLGGMIQYSLVEIGEILSTNEFCE